MCRFPSLTFSDLIMKRSSVILFLLLFIVSCISSQKLVEQGQFDQAIDKSVNKLENNPGNSDELEVLKKAYNLANMSDSTRIAHMELGENEGRLNEVVELYAQMDRRQDKIQALPSQVRNHFEFVNYDSIITEAKYTTADKLYRRGLEFMERGDKKSYRKAWAEFNRASEIYPGYEDVDQKIEEARRLGTSHALFVAENNSEVEVPDYFTTELSRITAQDLNVRWLDLDSIENENISYDQLVVLNVTNIIFSPESVDRQRNRQLKEIQDGFIEKRDSLGNIKRVPNMITVNATVLNVTKTKSAFIDGSLNVYEFTTNQLIHTESLSEEIMFENRFSEFYGDDRALSSRTRESTFDLQRERTDAKPRITINDSRGMIIEDRKEVPFPTNEQLLLYSADLLKERARSVIRDERNLF